MNAAAIVADYRRVLRERLPLIDLRAPTEFARGAFAHAVNLPLLTDSERAAVGTRYKACGQQAAIALGEELVAGGTRAARIEAWHSFVTTHPTALLYCWRGGLRSAIAQDWLHAAGVEIGRVAGGYKALRQTCLNVIQAFSAGQRLLVLGGRTGSGKTALLREFERAVDLEALAKHRGSAFGATASPQPTPIGFENELAVELLNKTSPRPVLLEDESRTIGRLAVPDALHAAMQAAPIVVLDVPRSERAQHIFREYVEAPVCSGADLARIHQRFVHAVDRIRRRLGGLRHASIRTAIDSAFAAQPISTELHLAWISLLLEWYYDPMYDHQLTAKQGRVTLRGDRTTVAAHLRRVLAE
jgi:tRNA 2-selenouridine synthase